MTIAPSEFLMHIVGCGYLGKKLITRLLNDPLINKEKIIAIVKTLTSQTQCSQQNIISLRMDLDDSNTLISTHWQHSIIYYFIPPPPQGKKDHRARYFIQQLRHYTAQTMTQPATKIILISTTGVYGDCQGHWVNETSPAQPKLDRALRRYDAEQQFQQYCDELTIPLVILRVSGIYGAGKLPLKRIRAKTPIVCAEDSPFSNRIHSDDLVNICLQAGVSDSITGLFNCADGHPSTMYDYFTQVARSQNLAEPPSISLIDAQQQLSSGILSYMAESRRIDNQKLLAHFQPLQYPTLAQGLVNLKSTQ
jgi:nucleoside-diphosphate-sugar epimerase